MGMFSLQTLRDHSIGFCNVIKMILPGTWILALSVVVVVIRTSDTLWWDRRGMVGRGEDEARRTSICVSDIQRVLLVACVNRMPQLWYE